MLQGNQVARWVLLGAYVVATLVALAAQPLDRTTEDLWADLDAGRVEAVSVNCPGDTFAGVRISFGTNPGNSYVCWDDGSWPMDQAQLSDGQRPVVNALEAAARRHGHEITVSTDALALQSGAAAARGVGALLTLIAIVVLVTGPQPRRLTKWATFWVIVLLPLSAGAIWWLLREAPWSRRANAVPEPEPGAAGVMVGEHWRQGGGRAFLVCLLIAVLVDAVLAVLLPGWSVTP